MRRFSQKSSLVTLSEINITPLLDLAFVLLIIFIITTPLLDHGLQLDLPKGGAPNTPLDKKDIRTIDIDKDGAYFINFQRISLAQVEAQLAHDHRYNPNLVVYIRAHADGLNKNTYAVIDACQRNGITRFSLRTDPTPRR